MTQYNSVNEKLSSSLLDTLKSAIKNKTGVILRLSSNMIRASNDRANFPHKLFLIDRQASNLRKTFANNSTVYQKLRYLK